jgi:hypothetical protein
MKITFALTISNCLISMFMLVVSVHLAKQFQRRRFLEINQPETRIAYGSHVY